VSEERGREGERERGKKGDSRQRERRKDSRQKRVS
jgi:hypothetical protein